MLNRNENYFNKAKIQSNKDDDAFNPNRAIWFLLLHLPLGFLLQYNPIFSTIHAVTTIIVGLYFIINDKHPSRLIYLMSYITGAELLWRGTHANIFWETGKYAITGFAILGLLRYKNNSKIKITPLIYFLLLLPSILIMPSFDREEIAFSLAGPMALAFAILFLDSITFNQSNMKKLLIGMMAPITSWGILVTFGIISADEITFSANSLFVTSGGIGPNQVSSILGLGALAAFLFIINEQNHKFISFFVGLIAIWLFVQTILTFSRGGSWTPIGAIIAASLFFIRNKTIRNRYFLIMAVLFSLFYFVFFPALDRFTMGATTERYSDFGTTGRWEIILSDLEVFKRHPILGVGPFQSKPYHAIYFRYSSSHTEYSRMLAEHGIFGFLSLLIFLEMILSRFLKKTNLQSKAFIVAFLTWGVLFMAHSATRLVAPSFMIALAFLNYKFEEPE